MKKTPILMADDLVLATLKGRKTVTRRLVKPQPTQEGHLGEKPMWHWQGGRALLNASYGADYVHSDAASVARAIEKCSPFGQVGNLLQVREAWAPADHLVDTGGYDRDPPQWIRYRADGQVLGRHKRDDPMWSPSGIDWTEVPKPVKGWKPSIHMPMWASRMTLEITGLRAERLWCITDEEARAEGVTYSYGDSPRGAFESLWEELYGKDPAKCWRANPWVLAITYRRLTDG